LEPQNWNNSTAFLGAEFRQQLQPTGSELEVAFANCHAEVIQLTAQIRQQMSDVKKLREALDHARVDIRKEKEARI
jgi:hypothetical protein